MGMILSLIAVAVLVVLPLLGVYAVDLRLVWGVIIPYLAVLIFLAGLAARVIRWARCPVPFRIPTTCGQQKSLEWIKPSRLENPSGGWAAVGRMAV
ncbi:MAG: menaquinol oxidoreductase, partial [Deltaproteobacteria bacterium]|nr:menaquinol oxidoreductase [Deltaproteobacteria bacterium]